MMKSTQREPCVWASGTLILHSSIHVKEERLRESHAAGGNVQTASEGENWHEGMHASKWNAKSEARKELQIERMCKVHERRRVRWGTGFKGKEAYKR